MKLVIATRNKHKLEEICEIFSVPGLEIVSALDYPDIPDVEEDGTTFEANAIKKAVSLAKATGLLALADDSGLEVDALGGAPGLYSARYSPLPGATDADRRAHLLVNLRGLPRPWTAHFHCTAALALPGGEMHFSDGDVYGEILPEERGSNGFGYDPLFLLPELGRTMAELTREEKNTLSHRARAVHAALPAIKKVLGL